MSVTQLFCNEWQCKKNDEGKEDNFAQSDALNLSQPLQHDI